MTQSSSDLVEADITALGHRGDGVAEADGQHLYVPFSAPGDRLLLKPDAVEKDRAALVQIVRPGEARVTPPCPHFGVCGGCALQHLSDDFVAEWKRQQIIDALSQRGLRDCVVRPTVTMPAASRRRAAFTAHRDAGGVQLAFHARQSKTLVPITDCKVLAPAIMRALPGLAVMLDPLLGVKQTARIILTLTNTGLDVNVEIGVGGKGQPNLRKLNHLAAAAEKLDLARISWNGEVLLTRRTPSVQMGGIAVNPPPGAFLQASAEGQAALTALVMEALSLPSTPPKGIRILDLFAGCGTFSFPVAPLARVHAVEGNVDMAAAITRAAQMVQGIKQVEVSVRDLQRGPFQVEELTPFNAVIFDPPSAGARAQAALLAASTVRRVIAVSCEPATFARDARLLIDGGYQLRWVAPVDQFRWSAEIELAALFERG